MSHCQQEPRSRINMRVCPSVPCPVPRFFSRNSEQLRATLDNSVDASIGQLLALFSRNSVSDSGQLLNNSGQLLDNSLTTLRTHLLVNSWPSCVMRWCQWQWWHGICKAVITLKKCSSIAASGFSSGRGSYNTPCIQRIIWLGKFFFNTVNYCKNGVFYMQLPN